MKKLFGYKSYMAAVMVMLFAATAGYFVVSNKKPSTTQDMSSYGETQNSGKTDTLGKSLPEINEKFEQSILALKQMDKYEVRKKAGEDYLSQLMTELGKVADDPDAYAFRLVDMVQIVRNALTTKCSNTESLTKFLELGEVQAIQLINGTSEKALSKYQKEQNERKAYNLLLCSPN